MKKYIFLFTLVIGSFWSEAQNPRVLTLQECVEIALENNLTVKRGALSLENAKIDNTQARANQLPNLNLGTNYGLNWGRSIDPTTNDFINQQITFSGLNGSSNVVLFNGFRLANSVKQSRVNMEATEYDLERVKNDVTINIVTFYLNVIFNKELLDNAQYQLQTTEEQFARTKKLVELGSLPLTNELDLASQVATNEVNYINAQNNLQLAVLSLKQAMLIPASEEIEIFIPELDMENAEELDASPQEVYDVAYQNMPEIKSASLGLENAAFGIKIARAGALPSLSLGGSFSTNYSDAFARAVQTGTTQVGQEVSFNGTTGTIFFTQPTFDRETIGFNDQLQQNLSRSLGLNLSLPVFNRFSSRSQIQRAKIALQQAEITAQETENTLRQQIESAYNDAQAAAKTYQASMKQVSALEEANRAVESQYSLGAANFTDYQVANNNLFRAKSDLVRAKFDFIFKKKIVEFYQGKSITVD
ncbi:MAG: outer membrane protein [Cyclobacteriaceae bacterium]|jgi:outer membrane protein